MSHAAALRCLGKRWLKVLWRMWQDRQPYKECLHQQNLRDHGSWVIARMTSNSNPVGQTL
jgi:hypothetical protein